MSRILAWSHWLLVCESFGSPPAGRPGPVSADGLALAIWMSQQLAGWVQALAVARYQLGQPGGLPGRRAQLAEEQAVRPFAPGDLVGRSPAQAERALAQEVERLVRLLEAPLVQFPAWAGRTRWESAQRAMVICLARLGQVMRQAIQGQGRMEARRVLEAALWVAYRQLVGQAA